MSINKFNIRVYGILINENKQVLVCDELIGDHKITKFPGGGLEFGEGTIDCIKREFIEETNNKIEVVEHFYTTDFFQPSAYRATDQIISIYYLVKPIENFNVITKNKFDFENEKLIFRWVDAAIISENEFTLPIDKIVGKMLNKIYK